VSIILELESSDGTSALPPDAVLQSRYRIIRQMRKGAMGAVYEASDQRLCTTVALKETLCADDRLRKQLEREACLLAHLDHPALPRATDFFIEGHRAVLVMQFIQGVDLAEIIVRQPGPLPLERVLDWADQLLDVVIYLHAEERQIVHRDIKPQNVKLTASGQIVLLDFGLAKAQLIDAFGDLHLSSTFGYTRQYAPLEQIQDHGASPQTDIYSLGATLYHLLTGRKPPDALERAAAIAASKPDPLTPANEMNSAVDPGISEILNRAMTQHPDDRYRSASEFRETLRRARRTDQVAVPSQNRGVADDELAFTMIRPTTNLKTPALQEDRPCQAHPV